MPEKQTMTSTHFVLCNETTLLRVVELSGDDIGYVQIFENRKAIILRQRLQASMQDMTEVETLDSAAILPERHISLPTKRVHLPTSGQSWVNWQSKTGGDQRGPQRERS